MEGTGIRVLREQRAQETEGTGKGEEIAYARNKYISEMDEGASGPDDIR